MYLVNRINVQSEDQRATMETTANDATNESKRPSRNINGSDAKNELQRPSMDTSTDVKKDEVDNKNIIALHPKDLVGKRGWQGIVRAVSVGGSFARGLTKKL